MRGISEAKNLVFKARQKKKIPWFLPHVVNKNGGNHDGKRADTEPGEHVNFRLPLKWWFAEQSPENESQGRDKRLPKIETAFLH